MKTKWSRSLTLIMVFACIVAIGTFFSVAAVTQSAPENIDTASETSGVKSSSSTQTYIEEEELGYFTDPDGELWQFKKIFEIPEGMEPTPQNMRFVYGKGIIATRYTGTEPPYYISEYNEMTVVKTGTFMYNGEERQYSLVPPASLSAGLRALLEYTIVDLGMVDSSTGEWIEVYKEEDQISYYDYYQDGQLDVRDLVFLNKMYSNTPTNFVTNNDLVDLRKMNFDAFWEIFQSKKNSGATEITIMYGDNAD